jgi:hypothetical protein
MRGNIMTTPWEDSIRQSGQLNVRFNAQMQNSVWGKVVKKSINEFNRLSRRHSLGVRLIKTTAANANVIVNLADGKASFSSDSTEHTISLPGGGLQGHSSLLSRSGKMFKSYVFLPSDPQINTPNGPRSVGNGVKLVIAVHEFIHCCGLSNAEHSKDDIFTDHPSVDMGSTPSKDVVVIHAKGRRRRRTAPPLFLRTTTVSRVRALWRRRGSSKTKGRKRASIMQDGFQTGATSRNGDVLGVHRRNSPIGIA